MKKNTIMEKLWDILFPRRCPVCDEPTPSGQWICPKCREKIRYIGDNTCFRCGKELAREEEEYCRDCRERKHFFRQGAALYDYKSMRLSLYRFKYAGRCEYADFYALDMERCMEEKIRSWNPQCLIPVPLHPKKERKRGYNQAEVLADKLGERLGIPVEKHLVKRSKNTIPMKELDVRMRQINLKKAFIIRQDDVKLERVVVVDDIYTSGSTVDAVAKVLLAAGVKEVFFISLAIGTGL